MLSKLANAEQKTISRTTFGAALVWIAAWAWTIVAGGGGLWLLWTKGPMAADKRLVRAVFGRFGLSGDWLVLRENTRASRSQVMFGLPLLLFFSSRGELLWQSEVDLRLISRRNSN